MKYEKSDVVIKMKVIWDMLLMGCPLEVIAETQGVSVELVKWLGVFMPLYTEYRQAARKNEFEKLKGCNANMLKLWEKVSIHA